MKKLSDFCNEELMTTLTDYINEAKFDDSKYQDPNRNWDFINVKKGEHIFVYTWKNGKSFNEYECTANAKVTMSEYMDFIVNKKKPASKICYVPVKPLNGAPDLKYVFAWNGIDIDGNNEKNKFPNSSYDNSVFYSAFISQEPSNINSPEELLTNEFTGAFIFFNKEDIEKYKNKDQRKAERILKATDDYLKFAEKEFTKYQKKKPDEEYNITVKKMIAWLKSGGITLDEYAEIKDIITYRFEGNTSKLNKFIKAHADEETNVYGYYLDDEFVTYVFKVGDIPFVIDNCSRENDDLYGLKTLPEYLKRKK